VLERPVAAHHPLEDGALQPPCLVAVGQLGRHALQERAGAACVRLPVEGHVVRQHRRRAWGVGQHGERVRVGNEPHLADGAHALDRLELVEGVHRQHGYGDTDAGLHALGETVDVDGLASDDAAVVAVEDAEQPYIRRPAGGDDLLGGHRVRLRLLFTQARGGDERPVLTDRPVARRQRAR
jgi:hypothetical protein